MFHYFLALKQDAADHSVANKTLEEKKISQCKTHQIRATLGKAAQVEEDGPGP